MKANRIKTGKVLFWICVGLAIYHLLIFSITIGVGANNEGVFYGAIPGFLLAMITGSAYQSSLKFWRNRADNNEHNVTMPTAVYVLLTIFIFLIQSIFFFITSLTFLGSYL